GRLKSIVQETSRREGDLFGFYYDRVKNIRIIKTFNAQQKETKDLVARIGAINGLHLKSSLVSSVARNLVGLFISFGPLIVFAYGGYQVMGGAMSIGALVAYIQYMNRIYAPSNDLSGLYVEYVRARESALRIYPLLSGKPPVYPIKSLNEQVCDLAINDLGFEYHKNKPVLNKITCEFRRGRKYAITGLNGSGKTTLVKILCKLYEPPVQCITINGKYDLAKIDPTAWMNKVTVISQESAVLYDTIKHNLSYANETAGEEEMIGALNKSGLNGLLNKLTAGLDTKVGDGDESIIPSGGQAQLISLARLFMRPADVVILDEVTASVDAEKEPILLQEIFGFCNNSIVIAISHKLSAIKEFDEVIFLKDGDIAEQGPPHVLMQRKGAFYELFKTQSLNVIQSV
ncbi:MAG: ABC transporter ATP-binding protein, partial [Dinghuibacter sp.]|nr:ABC transporter ATP-binding protein [Dinghuibacter sp.]